MKADLNSALRAIRAKCLECSGGSKKLVENCSMKTCPLLDWRTTACRASTACGASSQAVKEAQGSDADHHFVHLQISIEELLSTGSATKGMARS